MNVFYQEDELRKQADVFTGELPWFCGWEKTFVSAC